LELQTKSKFLIDKVNVFFGYQAVAQLKIVQNSKQTDNIAQDVIKPQKILVTEEELDKTITRLAQEIDRDYAEGKNLLLLCILKGSVVFMGELMKRLRFNCQTISIKLTSYEGTSTTGRVKQALGLTGDIKDRRVIVVEDIVDSGNTIVELKQILADKGAAESRICTMLLKPEAYTKDVALDYVAMEIPNEFIVGFGLDYDELGRNLKDIYVLDM
jgi:hypoxanthine phosphoribosyltransferase